MHISRRSSNSHSHYNVTLEIVSESQREQIAQSLKSLWGEPVTVSKIGGSSGMSFLLSYRVQKLVYREFVYDAKSAHEDSRMSIKKSSDHNASACK